MISRTRSLWSGAISFGIVNVPVKLVSAVKNHDIHFHQIDAKTKRRIHYQKVTEGSRKVNDDDIVKGYETGNGRMVLIEDRELSALAAAKGRTIDIQDFVSLGEVDPLYFDHPYFLVPDEKAGRAYWLLLEALEKTNRAAIAQVVMRGKEDLVLIRPLQGVLSLVTMRFQDEVIEPKEVRAGRPAKIQARELKIAEQLIDSMSSSFNPKQYKDTYRDRVLAYLTKKAKGKGEEMLEDEPEEKPSKVLDLMAALEESLGQVKTRKGARPSAPKRRRRAG